MYNPHTNTHTRTHKPHMQPHTLIPNAQFFNLQVMNGNLQLRFNLGSGEALLQQNTVRVDDRQIHNVTITRTERVLEVVIDGLYVNRTTSPGTEVALNIAVDAMYLGAGFNGTVTNGFIGCVSGFSLDRKDVPFDTDSADFSVLTTSEGIVSGCPIGTLFETPQPDQNVFPIIAGIVVGLFIVSATFVIICMVGRWCKNRRTGEHTVNNLRRNSTRRSWNFRERNASPLQEGFQWQPAPTYKHDMSVPPGVYRSTPEHIPDTAHNFNMNNRNTSPAHDFPTTNVMAETGFNAPSQRASTRSQQRARIPQPQEGFAFSQPNSGYRDDIDLGQSAANVQPTHLRSLSGQQSILSASTLAPSSHHDDTEVTNYLGKRLDIANSEIVELNLDEIRHYKEEGPYLPLGSVESLMDFVNELDPDYGRERKEMYQFPADTPVASPEGTLVNSHIPAASHVPIVYQLPPQTVTKENVPNKIEKTSPLTGQRFEADHEEKVREPPKAAKMERGRQRKTARSSSRESHTNRMENILERFHSIAAGHMPDEGRLV